VPLPFRPNAGRQQEDKQNKEKSGKEKELTEKRLKIHGAIMVRGSSFVQAFFCGLRVQATQG
jgi:hypothetical protein